MDHDEAVRAFGPWRPRTPSGVAELMRGYGGRWWIAGGWAVEAFTGVPRPHDDVDLSIPRSDVGLLVRHLAGTLDAWSADVTTFRLLRAGDHELADTCENLWLRPDGSSPWEVDVIVMSTTPDRWTYKRDGRVGLPLEEILWTRDAITYLRPEVQLLHKARAPRPKDEADLEACLPRLDAPARRWLADALALAHPGHPWLARL